MLKVSIQPPMTKQLHPQCLLGIQVYHLYSVPTILQVVTPISFLKKVILYRY